jgi:hypothetical protein
MANPNVDRPSFLFDMSLKTFKKFSRSNELYYELTSRRCQAFRSSCCIFWKLEMEYVQRIVWETFPMA